jgi:hypothetical protein
MVRLCCGGRKGYLMKVGCESEITISKAIRYFICYQNNN